VDCGRRAPLRRFQVPDTYPTDVTTGQVPLMGFAAPRSFFAPSQPDYWFPAPASRLPVSRCALPAFLWMPSPASLAQTGYPPTNFPPLQSPCVLDPPHTSRCEAPPLGFASPLRGISWQNPYPTASRPSDLSVHDVSHASDGFRLHQPCGFVSPHNHVQGSPYRGLSPLTQPGRLVAVPCPHVGWPKFAASSYPKAPRSSAPPPGL
jgi:hypothetical protein